MFSEWQASHFGNFAFASVVPWADQYATRNYLKPDALVTTNLLLLGAEKTDQGPLLPCEHSCFSLVSFASSPLVSRDFTQSPFPELSLVREELPKLSQAILENLLVDRGHGKAGGQT